jgi:AcrR family transcriptional regulator
MTSEFATIAPAQDRRVRRTRAALMRAAVALVAERGTAAVPVSDIAEAADVSRQVVYQQFGDRDTLLLQAAFELVREELLAHVVDDSRTPTGRPTALAMARHFAEHRAFYRAMLTSSSAFALNKSLAGLMLPANRQLIQQASGGQLDQHMVEDLAIFLTGGGAALVNTWVVDGEDPLDPEEFSDRLMLTVTAVTTAMGRPTTMTHDEEQRR